MMGAPPLPPDMAGTVAPQPQMPGMMQLGGAQGMSQPGMSPGMTQISEAAVRMAAEIDQALKMLAQSMPMLAPWVERTVLEMRYQVGMALNSGSIPTDPTYSDNQEFVDGSGRL